MFYTDDGNVVFRDVMNKRGYLVKEGEEVRFVTNIVRAVARDDCCAGVAIKYSYHRPNILPPAMGK